MTDVSAAAADRPSLSVVVRTQGKRPDLLDEALLCLAAQTREDIEVIVAVHSDADRAEAEVADAIARFAPRFADRVTVLAVAPGGRGRPLNRGMDRARGSLVAFLDDDDVVTANWAEVFVTAAADAPDTVIRSVTADQQVRRLRGGRGGFEAIGGVTVADHRRTFDMLDHLEENRTPICSYAVPLEALRRRGIRFDENLAVMEDWLFLVQAAMAFGVVDTGIVTAVYRRWDDEEATWHRVDREVWRRDRERIWQTLDAAPVVFPPGSVDRLRSLRREARARRPSAAPRPSQADPRLAEVMRQRDRAVRRLAAIEASTSWRLTAPVRAVLDRIRRRRRRR